MESLLATCSATCRIGGGLEATDPLDLARVLDLEEQQQHVEEVRVEMKHIVNRNQEVTDHEGGGCENDLKVELHLQLLLLRLEFDYSSCQL